MFLEKYAFKNRGSNNHVPLCLIYKFHIQFVVRQLKGQCHEMTLYWESQLIIKLDCDSMCVRVRMGFYTIPSKGENS